MNTENKKFLLYTARKEIAGRLGLDWKAYSGYEPEKPSGEELEQVRGTFVTLTIGNNLRGCIGQIIPESPIVETIEENALSAAFRDPRFTPLSEGEFYKIDIEISILTYPELVKYSDIKELLNFLQPGIHGVILRRAYNSATFLPQVWEDLPSKEEFLSHLSMKAGLSPSAWKDGNMEVKVYEVEHFNEPVLGLRI